MKRVFAPFLLLFALVACQGEQIALLRDADFERVVDGQQTYLYTLSNANGCKAQFTNYGGRWLSMWVPDSQGVMRDVVLGFDNLDGYLNAVEGYHGAITGRVCGRIGQGKFEMDGQEFQLAHNDLYGKPLKNHLHGGKIGYHKKVWRTKIGVNASGEEYVEFSHVSPDLDEGYPGTLTMEVRYTLTTSNAMRIEYRASTDKPTIVNLTNHAFFNLSGNPAQSVNHEIVTINADSYIACDAELVPTGEVLSVENTPIDFRQGKSIGESLHENHPEILKGKGYAIAYAVNPSQEELTHAATLSDEQTGIKMEVYSNQPSLQFYNAWLMDGTDVGKGQIPYHTSAGVVLETQGYPDAPNHENFPSIRVTPDADYYHHAEYRFGLL